ncbi:CHAT domain-containing protein [Galbibacter sp. EGI 63066]|uniref:CHAT domain-containing protein n=1 Tax=Galbibacter sp. EGI 63066 TaxID=2993559 RepID=UPI002248BCA1|nr:CHAT domain-containing protein [Galbibacter sp. EGI 63066]MCX2680340.1 CHAT domain-containing protein [Galbibacter sp. EGI 63066]
MRDGNFKTSLFWLVMVLLLPFWLGAQSLEESIYRSLDSFVANPTEALLGKLHKREQKFSEKAISEEEQLALVVLQCNMGYYYKEYNKAKNAINTYENAWNRYKENKLSGYDIIEYCLKPLGNLYTKTGNYTNAENTIKQYIYLAEKEGDRTQEIGGIINLSVVYHNTGNHRMAISLLKKGLGYPSLSKGQKQQLQNNLTTNLIALKEYEKAQLLLKQQTQPESNIGFTALMNASQIALRQGDYTKSLKLLNEAEKQIRFEDKPTARDLAKLYVAQAQVLVLQEKVTEARQYLQKALLTLIPNLKNTQELRSLLYAENTFIDLFDLYAHTENKTKQALHWYDLSFYVSRLLQDQLTSQKAKILHQATDRERSEKCIDLLYKAYLQNKNRELIHTAFQYAEESKVRVLKETVSRKDLLQQFPNDTLLQKEQHLQQQQEELINNLIRAQLNKLTNKAYINELTLQLDNVSYTLKTYKTILDKRYKRNHHINVSVNDLQQKLKRDNAAMLHYFYGKNTLYQFYIYESKTNISSIAIDSLTDHRIRKFIHYFDSASAINNDLSGFRKNAYELYRLLGLEKLSTYKNNLIIPDGLLNFIPFEALLSSPTKAFNFEAMPFLIKDHVVAYNTSTKFYMDEMKPSENDAVLGVFPVFKNSSRSLPYSLEEADFLKDKDSSLLLLHEKANKALFMEKAPDFGILHLSTHAGSGDFVMPSHIQFYDDVMLVQELYTLDLHPQLVVLSSCETGIGKLYKGEGAMSLARGFQYAGANRLLFSLWQINDQSTSSIMHLFYDEYFSTTSAVIANNVSKKAYLSDKSIPNHKKSPYYWGAFVYYGSFTKKVAPPVYYYITGIIIMLLLIVLLAKKGISLRS